MPVEIKWFFGTGEYYLSEIKSYADDTTHNYTDLPDSDKYTILSEPASDNIDDIEYETKKRLLRASLEIEKLERETKEAWLSSFYLNCKVSYPALSTQRGGKSYYKINLNLLGQINGMAYALVNENKEVIARALFRKTKDNKAQLTIISEQSLIITGNTRLPSLKIRTLGDVRLESDLNPTQELFAFCNEFYVDPKRVKKISPKNTIIYCKQICELHGAIGSEENMGVVLIKAGKYLDDADTKIVCKRVCIETENGSLSSKLFASEEIDTTGLGWTIEKSAHIHTPGIWRINACNYEDKAESLMTVNNVVFNAEMADFDGRHLFANFTLVRTRLNYKLHDHVVFVINGKAVFSSNWSASTKSQYIVPSQHLKIEWKKIVDPTLPEDYISSLPIGSTDPVIVPYISPEPESLIDKLFPQQLEQPLIEIEKETPVSLQFNAKYHLKVKGTIYAGNANVELKANYFLEFSGAIWQQSLLDELVYFESKELIHAGELFSSANVVMNVEKTLAQHGKTEARSLRIKAGEYTLKPTGKVQTDQLILYTKDTITTEKGSEIIANNAMVHGRNIYLYGDALIKSLYMEGRLIFKWGKLDGDVHDFVASYFVGFGKLTARTSITSYLTFFLGQISNGFSNNSIISFVTFLALQMFIVAPSKFAWLSMLSTLAFTIVNTVASPAVQAVTIPLQIAAMGTIRLIVNYQMLGKLKQKAQAFLNDPNEKSTLELITTINQLVLIIGFTIASLALSIENAYQHSHSSTDDVPSTPTHDPTPTTEAASSFMADALKVLPVVEQSAAAILSLFANYSSYSLVDLQAMLAFIPAATDYSLVGAAGGFALYPLSDMRNSVASLEGRKLFTLGPSSETGWIIANAGDAWSLLGHSVQAHEVYMLPQAIALPHFNWSVSGTLHIDGKQSFINSNLKGAELTTDEKEDNLSLLGSRAQFTHVKNDGGMQASHGATFSGGTLDNKGEIIVADRTTSEFQVDNNNGAEQFISSNVKLHQVNADENSMLALDGSTAKIDKLTVNETAAVGVRSSDVVATDVDNRGAIASDGGSWSGNSFHTTGHVQANNSSFDYQNVSGDLTPSHVAGQNNVIFTPEAITPLSAIELDTLRNIIAYYWVHGTLMQNIQILEMLKANDVKSILNFPYQPLTERDIAGSMPVNPYVEGMLKFVPGGIPVLNGFDIKHHAATTSELEQFAATTPTLDVNYTGSELIYSSATPLAVPGSEIYSMIPITYVAPQVTATGSSIKSTVDVFYKSTGDLLFEHTQLLGNGSATFAADGKATFKASAVSAKEITVLGAKGVECDAEIIKHTSKDSGFKGLHWVETQNTWYEVTNDTFVATEGDVKFYSSKGPITTYGATVYGKEIDFTAHGSVLLYDVQTQNTQQTKSFGLDGYSKVIQSSGSLVPSKMLHEDNVHINSDQDVKGSPVVDGPGKVVINARYLIELTRPIENAFYSCDRVGILDINIPLFSSGFDPLTSVPLVQSTEQLVQSDNDLAYTLNGMNLAAQGINKANFFLNSIKSGASRTDIARGILVAPNVPASWVNPSFTVGVSHIESYKQAPGPGGVTNADGLEMNAEEIKLENGYELPKNVELNAEKVSLGGTELHSSMKSDQVGVTFEIDIPKLVTGVLAVDSATVSVQDSNAKQVEHIVATPEIKNLKINAHELDLTSVDLSNVEKLSGHVDEIKLVSEKNTAESHTTGVQVGNTVGFSQQESRHEMLAQAQLNVGDATDFTVGHIDTTSAIVGEGIHADTVTEHSLTLENSEHHLAVSTQLPIGVNQAAAQDPFHFVNIDVGSTHGDDHHETKVSIPIPNPQGLAQFKENVLEAAHEVSASFQPGVLPTPTFTENAVAPALSPPEVPHESNQTHDQTHKSEHKTSPHVEAILAEIPAIIPLSAADIESSMSMLPPVVVPSEVLTTQNGMVTPEEVKRATADDPAVISEGAEDLMAVSRGIEHGAAATVEASYNLLKDVVVLAAAYESREYTIPSSTASPECDPTRFNCLDYANAKADVQNQLQPIVDLTKLYANLNIVVDTDLLAYPFDQFGKSAQSSIFYQDARNDLQDTWSDIKAGTHDFLQLSGPDKIETITDLTTRALLPLGITKLTRMGLNYANFGTLSKPPLYFDNKIAPVYTKPPEMPLFTAFDINNQVDGIYLNYVITKDLDLLMTPANLADTLFVDGGVITWSDHNMLANYEPVYGAGQVFVINKMVEELNDAAGHYSPNDPNYPKVATTVFNNHGIYVDPQKFLSAEENTKPILIDRNGDLVEINPVSKVISDDMTLPYIWSVNNSLEFFAPDRSPAITSHNSNWWNSLLDSINPISTAQAAEYDPYDQNEDGSNYAFFTTQEHMSAIGVAGYASLTAYRNANLLQEAYTSFRYHSSADLAQSLEQLLDSGEPMEWMKKRGSMVYDTSYQQFLLEVDPLTFAVLSNNKLDYLSPQLLEGSNKENWQKFEATVNDSFFSTRGINFFKLASYGFGLISLAELSNQLYESDNQFATLRQSGLSIAGASAGANLSAEVVHDIGEWFVDNNTVDIMTSKLNMVDSVTINAAIHEKFRFTSNPYIIIPVTLAGTVLGSSAAIMTDDNMQGEELVTLFSLQSAESFQNYFARVSGISKFNDLYSRGISELSIPLEPQSELDRIILASFPEHWFKQQIFEKLSGGYGNIVNEVAELSTPIGSSLARISSSKLLEYNHPDIARFLVNNDYPSAWEAWGQFVKEKSDLSVNAARNYLGKGILFGALGVGMLTDDIFTADDKVLEAEHQLSLMTGGAVGGRVLAKYGVSLLCGEAAPLCAEALTFAGMMGGSMAADSLWNTSRNFFTDETPTNNDTPAPSHPQNSADNKFSLIAALNPISSAKAAELDDSLFTYDYDQPLIADQDLPMISGLSSLAAITARHDVGLIKDSQQLFKSLSSLSENGVYAKIFELNGLNLSQKINLADEIIYNRSLHPLNFSSSVTYSIFTDDKLSLNDYQFGVELRWRDFKSEVSEGWLSLDGIRTYQKFIKGATGIALLDTAYELSRADRPSEVLRQSFYSAVGGASFGELGVKLLSTTGTVIEGIARRSNIFSAGNPYVMIPITLGAAYLGSETIEKIDDNMQGDESSALLLAQALNTHFDYSARLAIRPELDALLQSGSETFGGPPAPPPVIDPSDPFAQWCAENPLTSQQLDSIAADTIKLKGDIFRGMLKQYVSLEDQMAENSSLWGAAYSRSRILYEPIKISPGDTVSQLYEFTKYMPELAKPLLDKDYTKVWDTFVNLVEEKSSLSYQLTQRLGLASKGLGILGLGMSALEIKNAENWLVETEHQFALLGGGLSGGYMAGLAVSPLCGPTAPFCATAFSFIGGMLGASTANEVWNSVHSKFFSEAPKEIPMDTDAKVKLYDVKTQGLFFKPKPLVNSVPTDSDSLNSDRQYRY